MTIIAMGATFLLLRALHGLLFNVPTLVVWLLIGLLCIGAGKVRLHYHAYLTAASRNDSHARSTMAGELTMIHGVPAGCDEREFLRELQNALLWINFRFYLAPLFWLIVGGIWGPVTLMLAFVEPERPERPELSGEDAPNDSEGDFDLPETMTVEGTDAEFEIERPKGDTEEVIAGWRIWPCSSPRSFLEHNGRCVPCRPRNTCAWPCNHMGDLER